LNLCEFFKRFYFMLFCHTKAALGAAWCYDHRMRDINQYWNSLLGFGTYLPRLKTQYHRATVLKRLFGMEPGVSLVL
jgi:hypothetical protein